MNQDCLASEAAVPALALPAAARVNDTDQLTLSLTRPLMMQRWCFFLKSLRFAAYIFEPRLMVD